MVVTFSQPRNPRSKLVTIYFEQFYSLAVTFFSVMSIELMFVCHLGKSAVRLLLVPIKLSQRQGLERTKYSH